MVPDARPPATATRSRHDGHPCHMVTDGCDTQAPAPPPIRGLCSAWFAQALTVPFGARHGVPGVLYRSHTALPTVRTRPEPENEAESDGQFQSDSSTPAADHRRCPLAEREMEMTLRARPRLLRRALVLVMCAVATAVTTVVGAAPAYAAACRYDGSDAIAYLTQPSRIYYSGGNGDGQFGVRRCSPNAEASSASAGSASKLAGVSGSRRSTRAPAP